MVAILFITNRMCSSLGIPLVSLLLGGHFCTSLWCNIDAGTNGVTLAGDWPPKKLWLSNQKCTLILGYVRMHPDGLGMSLCLLIIIPSC